LLGIDVGSLLASSPNPASQLIGAQQMKYIFFEQHTIQGVEENGVTLAFKGQRTGIGSFLASSGSGGAAEYISRDAIAAFYAATREPKQMLEELEALFTRLDPTFQSNLALAEAKLGISLSNDPHSLWKGFPFQVRFGALQRSCMTHHFLITQSNG
jgi:hypothetical protein